MHQLRIARRADVSRCFGKNMLSIRIVDSLWASSPLKICGIHCLYSQFPSRELADWRLYCRYIQIFSLLLLRSLSKGVNQWWIYGRGPGAPLIFRPNWGPEGRKRIFLRPPPLRSRSATAFLICLNDTYVLLSVLNLTAMIFPRKIRNLSDYFDRRFDCSEDGSI